MNTQALVTRCTSGYTESISKSFKIYGKIGKKKNRIKVKSAIQK